MISSRLSVLGTPLLVAVALATACNTTKHGTDDTQSGKSGAVATTGAAPDTGSEATVAKSAYGTPAPLKTPGVAANTGAAGTLPDSAAAPADCYKADASLCKIEAEILRLTNAERAKPTGLLAHKPLAALRAAPKMSWVAREWSLTQAGRGSIGHDGFPEQREQRFEAEFKGSQAQIQAENVAMTGWGTEADIAQQLFDMWRKSPGHYANMMGPYAAMGVGVAKAGDGWYATEIFGDE